MVCPARQSAPPADGVSVTPNANNGPLVSEEQFRFLLSALVHARGVEYSVAPKETATSADTPQAGQMPAAGGNDGRY